MFEWLEWVSADSREGWYVHWRDAMTGMVATWFETLEDAQQFIVDLEGEQTNE